MKKKLAIPILSIVGAIVIVAACVKAYNVYQEREEERIQQNLAEHFGDISLSESEIEDLAKAITGYDSDADEETTEGGTEEDSTDADEESEEYVSEILNAERVCDREDYVGLQDLDIDEYVTLNDYRSMVVTVAVDEADDESIESYISDLLKKEITDRAVEEGDLVNIDYVGKQDGEAFTGGSDSGYELEIGSGTFIDGFEDGLIGVMPGETVDLELTFPEDYGYSSLAGQEVIFTVTVNSIVEYMDAEYEDLTVEEMQDFGLSYSSKEELWDAAKTAIEDESFEANKASAILNQILTESTIASVPEYLVEEQIQNYEIYMESMLLTYYGMGLEEYLEEYSGMTIEDFEDELYEECETVVEQYLVMEALARAEELGVTDELVREYAALNIAGYEDYTVDTYLDEVGYTTYRMFVVQDKLMELLPEIVEVVREEA